MKWLTASLLGFFMASPAHGEVPVTDRPQMLAFSASELQEMAAKSYRETLEKQKQRHLLDRNVASLKAVRQIAVRLIAQAVRLKPEAASWAWEVHITQDRSIDAYSMAGGKLLIGSNFIKAHQFSEDEVAILLGHEIGHVIAEHVREQATAVLLRNPKNPHRSLGDVIAEMNSDISVYLSLMRLSRAQEIEADQIGVRLAAMAGFRPAAALSFYRKLARDQEGPTESIFDTHGSPQIRRRIAPAIVAESRRFYRPAVGGAVASAFTYW
jgi:predicted Zn-dependent protease